MKKIACLFLVILGLSVTFSCQKEIVDNDLNNKMQIFDNCMFNAKIHSDYLQFIRGNNYNDVNSSDIEIFYQEHKQFVNEFLEKSSSFSFYSKATKENIVILSTTTSLDKKMLTKSTSLNKVETLGIELISDINELIMRNTLDYNQVVRTVLQKQKYLSCSEEEFLILSISAATYLDSIQYWEENIAFWMTKNTAISTKGWSWSRVWGYVKQFAQADAEAGLETAIGCAILGPVSLEAAFVGAGVGSAFECGKTIAAML